MSYDAIEKSNHDSVPVLFFQFMRKTIVWRYTTADRDVMMNGVPWAAVPIIVGDQDQSGSSDSDTLDLTAPNTIEVAQSYRGQTPSDTVSLIIYQAHALGEIPSATFDGEIAAVWVGSISDVKQDASDRLTITCKTLSSAFDREGNGPSWNRNCFHVIYDHKCRVNRDAYKAVVAIEMITGNSVTSTGLGFGGDGYYDGGYIEFVIGDSVYQRIGIERQIGPTCKLLGTTESLNLGFTINAYPGCQQTAQMCHDKFNNIPNFGGCDIMPGTSPFNGNPVF